MKIRILILFLLTSCSILNAQTLTFDGYVFEADNRGYLNEAHVEVLNAENEVMTEETWTDADGHFVIRVPEGNYKLRVNKDLFHERHLGMDEASSVTAGTYFYKIELNRKPGYLFDITIAEEKDSLLQSANAIHGAKIEVFNNTTNKLEFASDSFYSPNFQYTITKGNHYTFMLRKDGYLTKRIEAFVDVKGCILCIEGLDKMTPGVTDNLTEGHAMGTLLANVELQRVDVGKTFVIDNVYYDYGKANLREDAYPALRKLVELLKDNPRLEVELGSHTDSRGRDEANLKLSEKRAKSVYNYLVNSGDIERSRIQSVGYGETKLVNKCDDGVDCSNDEHQQNRRTEMIITGIKSILVMKDKSLQEMKEEEAMNRLLNEIIETDEVIEIKEGEDVPDEIKQQIEKQKKRKKKKN
jgi:outer membrane protein OmpA-like peptidoglycan-associated protein